MIRILLLLVAFATSAIAEPIGWRHTAATPGSTVYFWWPEGDAWNPQLPAGWTWFAPAHYASGSTWHWQWAWGVKVAPKTKPGEYEIPYTNHQGKPRCPVKVTVVKASKARAFRSVSRGSSVAYCQRLIGQGHNLDLAPGLHEWAYGLTVPDGATIRGHGARIVIKPNSGYQNRMFIPIGGMTLEGLTLSHSDDIDSYHMLYIHAWPHVSGNVTVRDCTIEGGQLGYATDAGMLVERCTFKQAGSGIVAPNSVWINNDFIGPTRISQHAFHMWGSSRCLLATQRFHGTTRGIVQQYGDCVDNMIMDQYFNDIRGGGETNGNECVLMEAGVMGEIEPGPDSGMRRNTFVDLWIHDCAGPAVLLYGSGMHDNTFWGVNAHVDSVSLGIQALEGGAIGVNRFVNWESTGSVDLRGNVGGQVFENVQLIDSVPKRGNFGPFTAYYEHTSKHYPIYADDVAQQGTYSFSGSNFISRRGVEAIDSIGFKPKGRD